VTLGYCMVLALAQPYARVLRIAAAMAASTKPRIAFIYDPATPNGKSLDGFLSQLDGRADIVGGNDIAAFKSDANIAQVDVIVIVVFAGGNVSLLPELWALCPCVRWVHSMAAGVETLVPLLVSLPRGPDTPLTNAKGAFSRSLAEYSLAAMLHFNKQVPRLQGLRSGKVWEKFIMGELHGMTVGLVGFGDIAKATAALCKAFGMRVVALRSAPGADDVLADKVYYSRSQPSEKLEVFKEADFVICSLPGGQSTLKFCGAEEFAAMKPSGIFISIGRGTCVDEDALVEALQTKKIAGAALDVFAVEPLPQESPLWQCENLLFSPHNADLTVNYIGETWRIFLEKLQAYSTGASLGAEVDKVKGY